MKDNTISFNNNGQWDIILGAEIAAMLPLDVIYSKPTAPFNEYLVRDNIKAFCKVYGIPYYLDELGMLWLNIAKKSDIKSISSLILSHTDHPGISLKGSSTKGEWLGGMPDAQGLVGAPIKAFNKDHIEISTIKSAKGTKVEIEKVGFNPDAAMLYFSFLPKGYIITNDSIIVDAADDLMIVCILLSCLVAGFKYPILLTRAEEFHLTGVKKLIKTHELQKTANIFVLDTTFESPLFIGEGVGIRCGDVKAKYTSALSLNLKLQLEKEGIPFKEFYSDKGDTEGSAFVENGFNVGSLAIAVKNQHNKNDAVQHSLPEIVSIKDILALRKTLLSLTF